MKIKILVEVTAEAPYKITKEGVFEVVEDQLRSFNYDFFYFTDVKLLKVNKK